MAILTVDELRKHVNSGLEDDALQRLLNAAEAAIVARAGTTGERTEIVGGGHRFISTRKPIDTALTVTITEQSPYGADDVTTLAVDDYLIRPGGTLIERLVTGTNARSRWYGYASITYTPVSDAAVREEVQIDLVRAALTYNPGLTGQQIGSWSEQYAANSAWNNAEERDSILARLNPEPSMLVVGG